MKIIGGQEDLKLPTWLLHNKFKIVLKDRV